MRKLACIILSLSLIFGVASTANAQNNLGKTNLEALTALGLVKGTDKGFITSKSPTRGEASVLIVKLLGQENEALTAKYTHPFKDVTPVYSPYIGLMYKNKISNGIGKNLFGTTSPADYKFYLTSILRAMGYNDLKGDFNSASLFSKAAEIGLVTKEFAAKPGNKPFLREDMVDITYNALKSPLKGSGQTLIQRLTDIGAVSAKVASQYSFVMDYRFTMKVDVAKSNNGYYNGIIKISEIPFDFYAYRGFGGNDITEPLSHYRIYASGAFSEGNRQWYKNMIETSNEPYFQNLRSKGDYEAGFELNDYSYLVLYDTNLDPLAYLELPPAKQNKTVYVKMEKLEESIKSDFDKYISDRMQKAVYVDPSLFRIEVRKEDVKNKLPGGNYLMIDRSSLPETVRDFKLVGSSGSDDSDIKGNLFLALRADYPDRLGGGIEEYKEGETRVSLYPTTMYTLRSADGTILGYTQVNYSNVR